MRIFYKFFRLILMAACLFMPATFAMAQSELVVEWEETPGSDLPVVNALRDAIAADSLRPADRVYVLKRGGFYWNSQTIIYDGFHLRLRGQESDELPEGAIDYGPAILQRVPLDGVQPGRMIENTGVGSNLTIKNIWIMGQTSEGVLNAYEPITLDASDARYTFDRVIFDRNDWHHLGPNSTGCSFYITNCKFRNIFGPTQRWEGLGIRLEAGADTVVIENNTFLNIGFVPFQSEAAPANYIRFNHNTLVNNGRQLAAGTLWREAYFTNNLIVNGFWHGEQESEYNDPTREDPHTGFFSIDELAAEYGANISREILLANNLYWRDPRFQTFYDAQDPVIRAQPFVNDTTAGWFAAWGGMVMQDNIIGTNPNLTTYPLDTPALFDSMTAHILHFHAGGANAARYFWDPNRPNDFVNSNWPLPEDFSYSEATVLTAGTDGLPIGDLNWFPSAKTTFEANKAAYIAAIEGMAESVPLQADGSAEAEALTLAGDAEIVNVDGFTYFDMGGAGWMNWDFNLDNGGQYDLNIWTHMTGENTRGQHVYVNGVEIHDCFGWNEYIWDPVYDGTEPCENPHVGMERNDWTWTRIIQDEIQEAGALTFLAGANTVRIEASWGYQDFAGFDLLEPGTDNVVTSMRAPDATYSTVVPRADASIPWVPSDFKAVALGAGGSVSWTVNASYTGSYVLRIFYATAGTATADVAVNGTPVLSGISLRDTSDAITDPFQITQGSNTIVLSSPTGGVTVDLLQLFTLVTSVSEGDSEIPEGYALAQNYPNPFNPSTNIQFTLAKTAPVKLNIYNVLGQRVATLIDKPMNAGTHIIKFDASSLSSGVYFYRIESGDFLSNKRMLFIK